MSKQNKNNYGINMVQFISDHESSIKARLESGEDLPGLVAGHRTRIRWLQHERLAHLLVTLLVSILFMFLYALLMLAPFNVLTLVLLGIVGILLGMYIFHYFRLENSVQRWYRLADEIDAAVALRSKKQ